MNQWNEIRNGQSLDQVGLLFLIHISPCLCFIWIVGILLTERNSVLILNPLLMYLPNNLLSLEIAVASLVEFAQVGRAANPAGKFK